MIYFTPRFLALSSALAWPLWASAQASAPATPASTANSANATANSVTNSEPSSSTASAPANANTDGKVLRFDIFEFVVEGNTLLPASLVEAAVYPFLGEARTVSDAEGARKALEARYHDAGYLSVVVELPPQKVLEAQGAIRLQVTEATLAQVRVSDAQYHLPSQIKSGMPSLQAGRAPNFLDMQDDLNALSRQAPDRELTPLVTAGTQEGTMEVDLKVQDTLPLHGSLEINSKQSPNTQRTRLEASLSYDNLWQKQHSLGLYWFYSPLSPAESNVLSVNYQLPLGQPGDRLYMSVTTSNSDTPTPLGGLTASRGETYALSWRRNLSARGSYMHATTFQLDLRDLKDRNDNVAEFTTEYGALRYPTLGISYDVTDFGEQSGTSTTFEAGLTLSAAGLSNKKVDCASGELIDQFECKRSGARSSFQVINLNASHRQKIYGGWGLMGRLQAQLASGPLVPAEQLVVGGVASVRGYFEGEEAGDGGVLLRTELNSPVWVNNGLGWMGLAFFDRAQLHRIDALPGERKRTQMGSVGLGLRLDGPYGLKAQLDWARVLFDTPLSGDKAGRKHRTELSVRQSF